MRLGAGHAGHARCYMSDGLAMVCPAASASSSRAPDIELAPDSLDTLRASRLHAAASCSSISKSPPPPCTQDAEYLQWRERHPCIIQSFNSFLQHVNGKRLAVFLDYDGTLTPIVNNPEEAFMSQQMRDTVRQVAQLFPTAIISGRGREKVEGFVQLPELFYAGSHGMDIAGPKTTADGLTHQFSFQPAAEFKPLIDCVYNELCERLADIPGASVEHNTFCVSAHFRNCAADGWQRVAEVVESIVAGRPDVTVTRGRKVLEIRPQVQWDKGSALLHLLEVLQLHQEPDVVSVYIGDDKTDEDAFQALTNSGAGWGILVSTKVKPTAAAYTVQDPTQVQAFLDLLVQYGCSGANGWMQYKGECPGWAPRPQQRGQQQQGSLGLVPADAAAAADVDTAAQDAGGGSSLVGNGVPAAAARVLQPT